MVTKKKIDLNYYMNLPWHYAVTTAIEDGEIYYIVRVNELPGVCTDAPTVEEAMKNIKEAMKGAFELYLKNGEDIPEPVNENKYKGNIAYRTTSKRHSAIARAALAKQISLSDVIDECIDRALK